MTRPIKFRAWDKQQEVMFVYKTHWNELYIKFNGEICTIDREGSEDVENHLILMQYTGLKDKHGTEIFEGDIIQSVHACGYPTEWKSNTVVKFENGAFYPFRYPPQEVYEVIGNIYENPELLKV